MGADPWINFVPYQPDIPTAMKQLQHEVFATGAYRYSEHHPKNIAEARTIAAKDGTESILDMEEVINEALLKPEDRADEVEYLDESMGRIHKLSDADLKSLYGTTRPTRKMIEANDGFFEWLERGVGLYIVVYAEDKPSEICFAGYSFD